MAIEAGAKWIISPHTDLKSSVIANQTYMRKWRSTHPNEIYNYELGLGYRQGISYP